MLHKVREYPIMLRLAMLDNKAIYCTPDLTCKDGNDAFPAAVVSQVEDIAGVVHHDHDGVGNLSCGWLPKVKTQAACMHLGCTLLADQDAELSNTTTLLCAAQCCGNCASPCSSAVLALHAVCKNSQHQQ